MLDKTLTLGGIAAVVIGIGVYVAAFGMDASTPKPQACTEEAKQCPDGSYVGRTGPNCEFAACPEVATTTPSNTPPVVGMGEHCGGFIMNAPVCATGLRCEFKVSSPDTGGTCVSNDTPGAESVTLKTTMGQTVTGLGVSLTPLEIISDSRCPKDVQCIWAGTVTLKVRVKNDAGTNEMTLALGKSATSSVQEITLIEVGPEKLSATQISPSSYHFTFEVKR